ncbi:MAG: YncE family protein [Thermoproteota archaeon]|nr:YncE family protein [Thermoproteota archaeon]
MFNNTIAYSAQSSGVGTNVTSSMADQKAAETNHDRVFVANELSNTITVIDASSNTVEKTIDLTGFDPRPPFAFNASKPPDAMHLTPLYNGAIDIHGMNASPDGKIIAVAARGSSNIYLINATSLDRIGPVGGIFVGREPHVPTFTPDGKSIWVTVRGSNYIATIDINSALRNQTTFYSEAIPTIDGPSMVWFSNDSKMAFVGSQKESEMDVIDVAAKTSIAKVDLSQADPKAFSPFVKVTPDGKEVWVVHKSSDAISAISTRQPFEIMKTIPLENGSKPNHVEFANHGSKTYAYVTLASVSPGTNTSKVDVIDTNSNSIIGSFDSHGKEAHGIWANPNSTRLYVGHEQSPILSVFDISSISNNATNPQLIASISLGGIEMPNGQTLKSQKSIDVVYTKKS